MTLNCTSMTDIKVSCRFLRLDDFSKEVRAVRGATAVTASMAPQ